MFVVYIETIRIVMQKRDKSARVLKISFLFNSIYLAFTLFSPYGI